MDDAQICAALESIPYAVGKIAAARIRELEAENADMWVKLRAARADAIDANRDALAAELQLSAAIRASNVEAGE